MNMIDRRYRTLPFGAELFRDSVRFRFWAPSQSRVSVVIDGQQHPMNPLDHGWHQVVGAGIRPGARYKYVLEDGTEVPDPASRFQPDDVHGPSEVIDPRGYRWNDAQWGGRRWEECVIYELHVGAFTEAGTFRAAIERIGWLADLGITAIEVMPVADFPGDRNWGYDGVLLFAPESSYGRPEDMKAFVDAAHARGIAVILDVVYNHFGPDGNYLSAYSPIFTDHHHTPWGAAVNYDAKGSSVVREFIIENALYWIHEFHLDGLRFDAVHAIKDDSELHVLEEIAMRIRQSVSDRPIHLMLENEENQSSLLARDGAGHSILYSSQWNDDMHHVLHAAATGEASGYYVEYAGKTELLGRALAEGFAFQGQQMEYRGSPRGQPSRHLPPVTFVSFIQNHDQVGNRAFGDRITSFAPAEAVRAIVSINLLLPQIPMLFMGEEFGASSPFTFFCDFEPALAEAVRKGRREEFAKFPEFHDPQKREQIPDPTARATFESSKLNWAEALQGQHAAWHTLYRDLLEIRHREIVPLLLEAGLCAGRYQVIGPGAVIVDWTLKGGATLRLTANLNAAPLPRGGVPGGGRMLWQVGTDTANAIGSWSVRWEIDDHQHTRADGTSA
jgi:maltooligosyltrehalose trehalohydrolase